MKKRWLFINLSLLFSVGITACTNGMLVSSYFGGGNSSTGSKYSSGQFIGAIGQLSSTYSGVCGNPLVATTGWCQGGLFNQAGGSGDGMFIHPSYTAVDNVHGFFYVSDTGNHRIEKFNLNTGAFVGAIGMVSVGGNNPCTTVLAAASGWCTGATFMSGGGDGQFNSPAGIAVDSGGDVLYIVDTGNNRIVKVTASTGAFLGAIGAVSVSTGTCNIGGNQGWCTGGTFVSGSSDGTFHAPDGIAIDPGTNTFFVSDFGNNRVSKFYLLSGISLGSVGLVSGVGNTGCTTVSYPATNWCTGATFSAGAGDGMYNTPTGIAVVGGFVYISDSSNYRIVKINESDGVFIGAIGNISSSLANCPNQVGATNNWCSGGVFASGTGDGMFLNPHGIGVDVNVNALFVADSGNWKISKIKLDAGSFIGAIGNTSGAPALGGTCPSSGPALGWCTGGTFVIGSSDGAFNIPMSVGLDNLGNIFVPDRGLQRVAKIRE